MKLTRLKARRERLLLTQQELADLAGISRASVSAIEGLRAEPQFATIKKIAAALDCDPFDLMDPLPEDPLSDA